MIVAKSALDLIGKTPLVKLNAIVEDVPAHIYGKCEFMNPGSSIKDRPALNMIEQAEKAGLIEKDTVVLEATSGNTGIGLALVCAVKGYRLIITMPESMSLERRKLLKAFGAELVLTPAHLGMMGSIKKVEDLKNEHPKHFVVKQFSNASNPMSHRHTTAQEIWDATEGKIDILVIGVGTGGSISGIGGYIKSIKPNFQVVAVEPLDSAVISGDHPGPHMIQGIGAGFIPENLDKNIIDEVIKVSNKDALFMARQLPIKEGLLLGISSGANVYAAKKIAQRPENKDKVIVTILCDYGERYLSTVLYQ